MHLVISSWAGLCVALSVILWQAFQLEGGAAAYPRIVIVGASASAGALLLTKMGGVAPTPEQRKAQAAGRDFRSLARLTLFVLIWAGYVLLLPWLGFMAATWLAIVSSLAVARARVSLLELLTTALFVLVFKVLIKIVLYVPMPQGWLDEQLEILLYSYF